MRRCECLVIAVALLGLAQPVCACTLCASLPVKTPADLVVDSEFVVFARESEQARFSYAPIETLKGEPLRSDIDVFVDSATRRRLQSNQECAVVLTRENTTAPWVSLGIADQEYQQVIRRIVALSDEWKSDRDKTGRIEFFKALFGHQNRAIFELAYLELGRAPYDSLRALAKSASRDDLKPIFDRPEYARWRALAILLCGLRGDSSDRELVRQSFRLSEKVASSTNLAAWATAYVEIEGAEELDFIEDRYLANAGRSKQEVRAVLTALSVHGSHGNLRMRDRVVRAYAAVLVHHPHLARLVSEDLRRWKRPEYREQIKRILNVDATVDRGR